MSRARFAGLDLEAVGRLATGAGEIDRVGRKVSGRAFELSSESVLRGLVDADVRLGDVAQGLTRSGQRAKTMGGWICTCLANTLSERANGSVVTRRLSERELLGPLDSDGDAKPRRGHGCRRRDAEERERQREGQDAWA